MTEKPAMTAVGILAHVDAGKTTLAEQILCQSGALRQAGRVDSRNTLLDHAEIERTRGITVFADEASFVFRGRPFTLLDTPGHVDFSGEMERCLSVMDCAVLVVSSVEGVQSHTRTLWHLLRKRKIPVMLFLSKTDRVGAHPEELLREFRTQFGISCVDFTHRLHEDGSMTDTAAEDVAELEDTLLEKYLNTGYIPEEWLAAAQALFSACRMVPVFSGAALAGEGVAQLLNGVFWMTKPFSGCAQAPFAAKVYKIRHDSGGRVAFLRITAGSLHPKDRIAVPGEAAEPEKCNELRVYQGGKYTLAKQALPGDLCAVTGVQSLHPGDTAGQGAVCGQKYALQPMLSARVLFDSGIPAKTVLQDMRELEDEEPLLHIRWNEPLQELEVQVMGRIQLEVLAQLMQERFQIPVSFGRCAVLYRETIAMPVVGCGHFEPLRHYAEVHLLLKPGVPGSGITFESRCSQDVLAGNWQRLIRTHVLEKEHRGVLTGAPLTDVHIVLLSGRAHLKHTEGGDFRQATYRAVRQGLMHAQNVLLEPWYQFTAEIELPFAGKVIADVQRMHGTCEPPEISGEQAVVCGCAPVSEMMDYPAQVTAFTKGRGSISLAFDRCRPCHNAQEVISQVAYQPEHDVENTPGSVFCSHGAGYPVPWQEACLHMHLPVETPPQKN